MSKDTKADWMIAADHLQTMWAQVYLDRYRLRVVLADALKPSLPTGLLWQLAHTWGHGAARCRQCRRIGRPRTMAAWMALVRHARKVRAAQHFDSVNIWDGFHV